MHNLDLIGMPKHLGFHLLCFDFGGGGSGGGTSTTSGTPMTWAQYVPKVASQSYTQMLPKLQAKYGQGLTPGEKAFYTGQGFDAINKQFTGAEKGMRSSLARAGVKGGAAAESISDFSRGRAAAGATVAPSVMGTDIAMKQQNLKNLQAMYMMPGSPTITGSTTTTKPAGGS